jgi:hypothetical protein
VLELPGRAPGRQWRVLLEALRILLRVLRHLQRDEEVMAARSKIFIVPVKSWRWIWLSKLVYGLMLIPLVILFVPYLLAQVFITGLEWCTGKLGTFYIRNYNRDAERWKRERRSAPPA